MAEMSFPTKYKSVQFRSRLEAKWAVFFDLLKWNWEYEPADDGAWTPDFILRDGDETLAVEVKPIEWPERVQGCGRIADARPDLAKVRASPRPLKIVLGSYPIGGDFDSGGFALGVMHREHGFGIAWLRSHCWEYPTPGVRFDITGRPISPKLNVQNSKVEDMWDEACSKVQWMAQR